MPGTTYRNFDITIGRDGDSYVVRMQSPAGEVSGRFEVPFQAMEIENFLLSTAPGRGRTRRVDTPAMDAAKRFGGRLFNALFTGESLGLLRASLNDAYHSADKLRIRLRLSDAPNLADLPWEYLYNSTLNRFLALDDDTALVRYLDSPERVRPILVSLPLRVLVIISDPGDFARLDAEREWQNLHGALGDLLDKGLVHIDLLEDASMSALRRKLAASEYHILHYIGHGSFDRQSEEGVLIFKDAQGRGKPVSGQELGWLLHNHKTLALAVLNACEGARSDQTDLFAGTAQSLVQQGIPAVVAMQFEITDDAAKTFAHAFYSGVAAGHPVEASLTETRVALYAEGHGLEWATPVLYLRAENGRVFDVRQLSTDDLKHIRSRPLYEEATTALDRGDWAVAEEKLKTLIQQDPTYPQAIVMLEKARRERELAALYAEGLARFSAGEWHEASNILSRVAAMAAGYQEVDTLISLIEGKIAEAHRTRELAEQREMEQKKERERERLAESVSASQEPIAQITDVTEQRREPEVSFTPDPESQQVGPPDTGTGLRGEQRVSKVDFPPILTSPPVVEEVVSYTPIGPVAPPIARTRSLLLPILLLMIGAATVWVIAGFLFGFPDGTRTSDNGSGSLSTLPTSTTLRTDATATSFPVAQALATSTVPVEVARATSTTLPETATATSVPIVPIFTLTGHTDDVEIVAFSSDGKTLASGSGDSTIKLWNVEGGTLIRTLEGHTDDVEIVAFSPDGKTLASGSSDWTIKLWNVEGGTLIRTLEGHTDDVEIVAFSPDDKTLASGSWDSTIKLWNVDDGTLIRTLEIDPGASVAFSPDGKTLASGSWDSTIKLWSVEGGTLIRTLEGHINTVAVYTRVASVAFSPDGKTLASGSWDSTIKLWNVDDGTLIRTLEGHTDYVRSVAFSPDGKTLASGSSDWTIKLWNVDDGTLIRTLKSHIYNVTSGHIDDVASVAFSPDGKILASGSWDNTIKLWPVP
jgi:WD40 repeat protein